ncbi:MAG TPA: MFS transporter, partial [Steroidobacteraceae bacterium]|nr:MFS transporter [Steroidobacteraceae bacterium]
AAVLVEPIRAEFGVLDWHMGLLTGPAFALFYTVVGVPLARLADRYNRVNIIAISLLAWSVFTGLTGVAKTFLHMVIARVGVAVGEAGCNPAAYSLIGDYFDARRRATALSIFQMGGYIGSFLGLMLGGWIGHHYGWRSAFLIVGLPGIAVALLLKFTLRELPRGSADPGRVVEKLPSPKQVLLGLLRKSSFCHLAFAAALHNFAVYGVGNWYAAFLMRSHGLTLLQTSMALAVVTLIGGALGTALGGIISDRLATRRQDSRYYLWVPALSLLLGFPITQSVFIVQDTQVVIALLVPVVMFSAAYLAPSITATYTLVGIRERALASAVLLFILNLIGLGLGPLIAGITSDVLRKMFVSDGMSEAQALAEGLRWSLRIMVVVNLWSALHYFLAARTLRAEEAKV